MSHRWNPNNSGHRCSHESPRVEIVLFFAKFSSFFYSHGKESGKSILGWNNKNKNGLEYLHIKKCYNTICRSYSHLNPGCMAFFLDNRKKRKEIAIVNMVIHLPCLIIWGKEKAEKMLLYQLSVLTNNLIERNKKLFETSHILLLSGHS